MEFNSGFKGLKASRSAIMTTYLANLRTGRLSSRKEYRVTCDTDAVLSLSGWSQLAESITRHNAPNTGRT